MTSGTTPTIFSVSELNQAVRDLLEHSFGLLWVEGEISNLARPRSGHVYFSLKDGEAQVRCALFRQKARLLRVSLEDGAQVRVRARVSLYGARGDYQLIVEHAEDAGAGALQRAFEALRARLDAEGLFAAERKRALPARPARIGVVTSVTGAAIRDVVAVIARRYPLGAVRVYGVPVQGDAAPAAIASAVERASTRADCDVLLVVRGGGSLEDLWAFNDERVARAIVACHVPVVSGVGHEVDVTIADFAADVRAATPSAAAELVCPDLGVVRQRLAQIERQLMQRAHAQCDEARDRLTRLVQRLLRQRPRRRLEVAAQRLDEVELRLQRIGQARLRSASERLRAGQDRLHRSSPRRRIRGDADTLAGLVRRLDRAIRQRQRDAAQRLQGAARTLHSVSPLQTVARGYAIARDTDQRVIRNSDAVDPGDRITIDLARGRLECDVHSRIPPETD